MPTTLPVYHHLRHHHLDQETDQEEDQEEDQKKNQNQNQFQSHFESYIYPYSYSHRSDSAHSSTASLTSPSLRSFSSLSTFPPPLFKPGCDMTTANNESFTLSSPSPTLTSTQHHHHHHHQQQLQQQQYDGMTLFSHDRNRIMEEKSFAASLDPGFETDTPDDDIDNVDYDGRSIAVETELREGFSKREERAGKRGNEITDKVYDGDMVSLDYGNAHVNASTTRTRTRTVTETAAGEDHDNDDDDISPPQNKHYPSSSSLQHQSIMHRRQGSNQLDSGFPQVQPGGSLMLAWQVRSKNVLVIGGGKVAAERIYHALNADAKVTVISPSLNPEVAYRVSQGQIRHIDRKFISNDLDGDVSMVLIAIDNPQESLMIWQLCKERRIPVNVADVPDECDFYFGSVYRDGPLQVMVSTNGNGPKMANLVKRTIQGALPENMGAAIRNVGLLRSRLRTITSAPGEGPKRMKWISRFCEQWTTRDLVNMDEQDIEDILAFYASNTIPTPSDIRRHRYPGFSDSSILTSTPSVRPRTRRSTGTPRSEQAHRENRNQTPSHPRSHHCHRLHHRTSSVPSSIHRYSSYYSDGHTMLSTLPSVSTNMRTDSSAFIEEEGETAVAEEEDEEEEEYPLVLLHCTLLPPSLCINPSLPFPSEQALRDALPEKYFRRWKILEDKVLASGVLRDRGMLISHPEDDYSLLEERIFESLDLSSHSRADDRDRVRDALGSGATVAATATATTLSPGEHVSTNKRKPFDLRIYAANGLMRSGAWRAAWREMEKVDVEINLSLPGEVRRGLEKRIMEELNAAAAVAPPHPPSPLSPHSELGNGIGIGMSSRSLSPVAFDSGAPPVAAKSQEISDEKNDVRRRKTMMRRTAEVITELFADGRNCAMLSMGVLVCYMAMQTSKAKDDH